VVLGYPKTLAADPGREEPNVLTWKWDAD
jgi:hypothetical protein